MLEICGGDYAGICSSIYFEADVVVFINHDLGVYLVWMAVKSIKCIS